MSTSTLNFRTRTRPQLLQEPIDTRSPLIKKLDEIEVNRSKPLLRVVSGRDPWGEGLRWRYLEHENANNDRRDDCQMCKGTAEITVSDGYGGVDFDLCPRCQVPNPYRRRETRDVLNF